MMMSMEETGRLIAGEAEVLRETCPSATLSTRNPTGNRVTLLH
jgi:hypothetical protein